MIYSFLSITTWPTFVILLLLIESCFGIACSYDVVLCSYQKWFFFFRKVSLSKPCPSFLVSSFVCLSLEVSIELFPFLFLFSGYFCSVDGWFTSIAFDSCNQFSYAILNTDKLSFSFFSLHIPSVSCLGFKALRIIISFLVRWSICLSSSLFHFKNGPEYVTKVTAKILKLLTRLLLLIWLWVAFPFSYSYFFFISTYLMLPASNILKYI